MFQRFLVGSGVLGEGLLKNEKLFTGDDHFVLLVYI